MIPDLWAFLLSRLEPAYDEEGPVQGLGVWADKGLRGRVRMFLAPEELPVRVHG